jgi:hypothetical protein
LSVARIGGTLGALASMQMHTLLRMPAFQM